MSIIKLKDRSNIKVYNTCASRVCLKVISREYDFDAAEGGVYPMYPMSFMDIEYANSRNPDIFATGMLTFEESERDEQGRFSYWPYKEPLADLVELESKDRYVFSGQYQQRPSPLGGDIIQGQFFGRYKVVPPLRYRKVIADTAQKTAERNDYSVFECWGHGEDGRVYLLDLIRGKWPAPELKRRAIAFWNKHKETGEFDSTLRQMLIEDKSSGTGLIQDIQESVADKLTRVMDVVSYIESGLVFIPEAAPWVSDFVAECEAFTADDTHAHDDMVDPMVDAINDMLVRRKSIYDAL